MTERFMLRLETSRPTEAKPKSPQGVTDCHVGLRPPRNDGGVLPRGGGVWSPRPMSAVNRDVEDAVPYGCGGVKLQKGQSCVAAQGCP